MPASRQLAEDLGRELAGIYADVAERLAQAVAIQLRRDLAVPDDHQQRQDALRTLQRAAEQIVVQLDGDMAEAVERALVEAHRRGSVEGLRELVQVGRMTPAEAAALRRALPGAEAVQRLAFSLTAQLRGTHLQLTRWPVDVYREVTSRAAADILLGVSTRRQAAQRIWEDFVGRGVTGFVDRAGRAWRLESYVEMASRTVAAQAAVEAHLDRLADAGIDLVIVSDAHEECERCRPWENRVLSRSGSQTGIVRMEHATRDGVMVTVDIAGTVDQAVAAGLLHPNCRHSLSAFLPGATSPRTRPPDTPTADPAGDKARQRLRYLEREVRKAKLQTETALDELAAEAARARVRELQAQIREHVAETGVTRQRWREQVRLGHKP